MKDNMGRIKDIYTKAVLAPLAEHIMGLAKDDLEKASSPSAMVLRDRLQYSNTYPGANKKKPGSGITFDALRRFSYQYDVARAAINRRKRQLNGLEWDIVASDPEDGTDYKAIVKDLKKQFTSMGGYRVRFREMLDTMVEDLLVLDALAIYKRPTIGGKLHSLQVVDAATIILDTDESGGTPMPPQVAYRQMIRGKEVATFTADEMYYEMMNPRSYTPYGLSPIESLILGVSAALKSEVYNLHLLTEGNIPEGFFGVPESWTPKQIKEFQELWDAAIAGDTKATSKVRFVPSGKGATGYAPTVKPEDMRYKEFQEWLMKKTCMMFEIPPNELGFSMDVNRANGEVQQEIGFSAGLLPLAKFFEEIFTDIIQNDLGYPDLAFKYVGLEFTDEKLDAEIAAIKIQSGQTTVDEVRKSRGQEPLGVDKPFVIGTPTFIDQESMDRKAQAAEAMASSVQDNQNANQDNTDNQDNSTKSAIKLASEMRAFRKYAMNRKKLGKSMRAFKSDILPEVVTDELNSRIQKASDAEAVRDIFSEFMRDYQIQYLADVAELRESIGKVIK